MNIGEARKRNVKLVAEARTLPYTGHAFEQLEYLAEKYQMDIAKMRQTLMRFKLKSGQGYKFLVDHVRSYSKRESVKFPKGFCLMCKKLSNKPVPLYVGEDAPICPACHGTGKYCKEIMRKKSELRNTIKQLCIENETYEGFLQACDSNNEDPVSRKSWYGFRREQKRRGETMRLCAESKTYKRYLVTCRNEKQKPLSAEKWKHARLEIRKGKSCTP